MACLGYLYGGQWPFPLAEIRDLGRKVGQAAQAHLTVKGTESGDGCTYTQIYWQVVGKNMYHQHYGLFVHIKI